MKLKDKTINCGALDRLKEKYNDDDQLDLIYQTLEAIKEEYEDSDSIEDVFKKFFIIACECDDPNCPKWGIEGEIEGHIEDCTCAKCHEWLGKTNK